MTTPNADYVPRVVAEAINRCGPCDRGIHRVCHSEGRYCECRCRAHLDGSGSAS